MHEGRSKNLSGAIRVIIHSGDCNLNRQNIIILPQLSVDGSMQRPKPGTIKDEEGRSAQKGLDKK